MGREQFVVESMSHCFFCLNRILHCKVKPKSDKAQSTTSINQSSSIYSVQHLSRFLKLDMKKVFNINDNGTEQEFIPSHLLEKVKQSTLKVELCEECVKLMETFSGVCRQLERLEIEALSSLKLIHEKLEKADQICKIDQVKSLANSSLPNVRDVWKGKVDILEALRTDVAQKCSSKLSSTGPRVKVRNLTMQDVVAKQLKMKTCSIVSAKRHQVALPNAKFEGMSDVDSTAGFDDSFPDDHDDDGDNIKLHSNSNMGSGSENEDLIASPSTLAKAGTTPGHTLEATSGYGFTMATTEAEDHPTADQPEFIVDPKTKKVRCSRCSTEFKDKTKWKRHYQTMHLKVRYKCKLCGEDFRHLTTYRNHNNTVHLGIKFRCAACERDFNDKSNLTRHQKGCRR